MTPISGISFVVPVHNGAACIRETLAAIVAQADGRPMEILVVDDCSRDGSSDLLRDLAKAWPIAIVRGEGRGAAAAINAGVRAARFPIICQVDQDVVVGEGWMRVLAGALEDPSIAAAQGYYATDPAATLCARAMSFDLEQRYAAIRGGDTGHVCTGNSAYRASALHQVGLFDETFGYGYDNDMSYRLQAAGYRLRFCRDARSTHRWREGISGYLTQQYGFGYGRIDLIAKHPTRMTGDSVSRAAMMAHPIVMAVALAGLTASLTLGLAGVPASLAWSMAAVSAGLVGLLALERLGAGIGAARRFDNATPLVFPLLHLGRDAAWVAAIAVWMLRRALRHPPEPSHSMRPRSAAEINGARAFRRAGRSAQASRSLMGRCILTLIPAHNEAANLIAVVAELRTVRPNADVLIVDDGSTDQTAALVDGLNVRWLRFPERIGIGGAMRAGLRYAERLGYNVVVRIDGDGQHRPEDIERLLAPVENGMADVALGSRFTDALRPGVLGVAQRTLGACLSALTGHRVTDPTSGFCVLGPRAVRLLAEHHPTGYPEPELRLFLSRNALRVVEVPVQARPRLRGRTSLTPVRLVSAAARVLLAMVVVPLRDRIRVLAGGD
ncbi:MAG TPA: glycosyltransferase [Vicinamibacterales bacterium]|nr:glycosyltransferase [Vicinamibacterales bacterium]